MRINSVGSGLALADLQEVLQSPNLTTLVVPKVESAADVCFVRDVIAHSRPKEIEGKEAAPVTVIGLIESARSLMDLHSICSAAPGLLSGLTFAAEDFALDLSLTRTVSLKEFLFARSAIVTAARAFEIPSALDLVATAFRSEADQEQLKEECEDGVRMGFNGKQCIHPSQVSTVDSIFSPSKKLVEWAVRLVIAQRKAYVVPCSDFYVALALLLPDGVFSALRGLMALHDHLHFEEWGLIPPSSPTHPGGRADISLPDHPSILFHFHSLSTIRTQLTLQQRRTRPRRLDIRREDDRCPGRRQSEGYCSES